MTHDTDKTRGEPQRRQILKGAAAVLASGMFPAIHAQEKITLRYLGTAVNQDKTDRKSVV